MDSVQEILLSILAVVSDAITSLVGLLPNPDPFPQIIEQYAESGSWNGLEEIVPVVWYWLDSFFVADAVLSMLSLWFLMFPIAWIIMLLWKWLKAR